MQKKAILRRRLTKEKVDGILITDLVNVRYLSGFTGSSAFLVITKRGAVFGTDFRYQQQAGKEVSGYSILIERGERSLEIRDICRDLGIGTLAVEANSMTVGFYRKLGKRKIKLKPVENAVERMRITKTPDELANIKKAVGRAEAAFRKLQPFIRPGVTERALSLRLEENLRKESCKTVPFAVIVASGPMSALPHARPTERKLKKGDLVVFDWGGECNGYFSDMTRTVLIRGKDMSGQKALYYHVLEAQKRAVQQVRSGRRGSDVDAAARDYIEEQGYGECFGHGTGHGVGLAVHEKPVVSWRSKDIIKENMVFTVEPGIYVPRFGGVRIEDMVAVKKNSAEVLTSLPKKLKIL